MALFKLITFACLLVVAAHAENRTARQLFPTNQPSIQYYFINKVHNGPAADPEQYTEALLGPTYNQADESEEAAFRQLGIFGGIFNNRFTNGNANLNNYRPLTSGVFPFIRNPNANGILSNFEPCTNGNGQSGVCVNAAACAVYGGQSGGQNSCGFGSVCCVNTISKCGGIVTLNNTYFQKPGNQLTTPTACTLTIKLDKRLQEQKQAICQVRLDFLSFSISQPDTTSTCATDNFQVSGSLNAVPTICGDNDGQHMYLHTARSDSTPSDLRLTFNFGDTKISRSWNIRIAMLPCVSTNLAPTDCLQYFTAATGTVFSFNWKDVAVSGTTTRQLANQRYKICFRTEVISDKRANTLCLSQCIVSGGGDPFEISVPPEKGQSRIGQLKDQCQDDYLVFVGGSNSGAAANQFTDRYCGGALSALDASSATTVCSTARPMELLYRTNDDENNDTNNSGFCLSFQQRSA